MTGREKKKGEILAAFKNFFTKNVAIKIMALVFAMLIWGYVLTDQKPMRVKTVPEVSTSFDGEAELQAQSLCVRGSRSEILQDVTVAVRTQITNYANLTGKQVNASISLKNISEPRIYEIPVTASVASSLGTVQSVTPSTVTVEIDQLRDKNIEVTFTVTGELPEGYWADADALKKKTTTINISGAKTDITRVVRAECIVDLTGRTADILNTFDVTLYDAEGEVVPSDILVGTLPSVTVNLPIYPMRNVPVDVMNSLIGMDNLASNHEIASAVATPATVRIRGKSQEAVDAVESIQLEPIAVNGLNAPTTMESALIVPEGISLIDADKTVSVLIDVRETQQTQSFEQLEVQVTGQKRGMDITLDTPKVDLTISGRVSIVSIVKRSDVSVTVDITGLDPGTYELQLYPFVKDEGTTVELNTILSHSTVKVTIRKNE